MVPRVQVSESLGEPCSLTFFLSINRRLVHSLTPSPLPCLCLKLGQTCVLLEFWVSHCLPAVLLNTLTPPATSSATPSAPSAPTGSVHILTSTCKNLKGISQCHLVTVDSPTWVRDAFRFIFVADATTSGPGLCSDTIY